MTLMADERDRRQPKPLSVVSRFLGSFVHFDMA
jgi:hypothetical protein